MRYLWEVVLETQQKGIPLSSIRFTHAPNCSAYMELALTCLNQTDIYSNMAVEVNTYYRFYSIFKDIYEPNQRDYKQIKDSLTNLILHVLTENDVRRGMTKEEYYKKMLIKDIKSGNSGEIAKHVIPMLENTSRERLLSGWLRTYQTGSSLTIFIDMIHGLIDNSIVYHSKNYPNEILIYIGSKRTDEIEQIIQCVIEICLDIRYHVEIFYEYHFGIIGIEETMMIDEIAIY